MKRRVEDFQTSFVEDLTSAIAAVMLVVVLFMPGAALTDDGNGFATFVGIILMCFGLVTAVRNV